MHHIWSRAPLAATLIRCRSALFGHRPDPPAFARADDDGQEHDVALVALEVVGVAAADPSPLCLLLAEPVNQVALDELGLASPNSEMTPIGLAVMARVGAQLGDVAEDVVGFGRVGVGSGFPVAIGDVNVDDTLPGSVRGLFAKREDGAAVGELVGELDDLRRAAEVLAEHDDAVRLPGTSAAPVRPARAPRPGCPLFAGFALLETQWQGVPQLWGQTPGIDFTLADRVRGQDSVHTQWVMDKGPELSCRGRAWIVRPDAWWIATPTLRPHAAFISESVTQAHS